MYKIKVYYFGLKVIHIRFLFEQTAKGSIQYIFSKLLPERLLPSLFLQHSGSCRVSCFPWHSCCCFRWFLTPELGPWAVLSCGLWGTQLRAVYFAGKQRSCFAGAPVANSPFGSTQKELWKVVLTFRGFHLICVPARAVCSQWWLELVLLWGVSQSETLFMTLRHCMRAEPQERHSEVLIEFTFARNTRHHNSKPHFTALQSLSNDLAVTQTCQSDETTKKIL